VFRRTSEPDVTQATPEELRFASPMYMKVGEKGSRPHRLVETCLVDMLIASRRPSIIWVALLVLP
jgi:hypothetical protein